MKRPKKVDRYIRQCLNSKAMLSIDNRCTHKTVFVLDQKKGFSQVHSKQSQNEGENSEEFYN